MTASFGLETSAARSDPRGGVGEYSSADPDEGANRT
jgi:hypothetical protein